MDQELSIEGTQYAINMGNKMGIGDKVIKPEFIDWLAYFRRASYVITDSLHGTCFSVIFGKKFVSIKNRSTERFDSLANLMGCPELFFDDARALLGKRNIFSEIDYDAVHKRMEEKRKDSIEWLRSALDKKVKPKSSGDSTRNMLRLYEAWYALSKKMTDYAYEEEQKQEINAILKTGKSWLESICLKNHVAAGTSKLSAINNLQEYFSRLKENPQYVVVLSAKDESSNQWGNFVKASGLPLRTDIRWRNSYVAVIDDGVARIDEKAGEELDINYEFVVGHTNYSVEYLNNKLKVCCEPLKYCKIRIKSKGFTVSPGRDRSEIIVDNVDYSMNRTGINMVVIDKETGAVVDSFNINTYSDPALRIIRR